MSNRKKRIIFHIPYEINRQILSGTNLRPLMLKEGFEKLGYEIEFISGNGNERKKKIVSIIKKIKSGVKYEFLYSESSTMPTLLTEKNHIPKYPFLDFNFFKFCKKNCIKIGLFYRDVYWNFPEYKISRWKGILAKKFYKYDLKMYNKYVDILFLPTKEMEEYIPIDLKMKIHTSFPGSNKKEMKFEKKQILKLLYVGGTGEFYNYSHLIEIINKEKYHEKIELILVTREDEFKKFYSKKNIENKNIVVKHIDINSKNNGEIQNIDIALLYLKPVEYRKFVAPLKLFEYMMFNLPILSVKNTFVGKFIEENNIGWAINYGDDELEKFLDNILRDNEDIMQKREKIKKIKKDHTWENRANEIVKKILTVQRD